MMRLPKKANHLLCNPQLFKCDVRVLLSVVRFSFKLQNEALEIEHSHVDDVLHRDLEPHLSEIRLEEREHAEPTQNNLEINEFAPLNQATCSWEVGRGNVIIEMNIGGGRFGQVAQETASNLPRREGRIKSDDNVVLHRDSGPHMPLSEIRSEEREYAEPTQNNLEMNEYAPLNPATRSWEVERENVIIEKVIGGGAFGQVAQGTATNLPGREGRITVAIKMLHGILLTQNSFSSQNSRTFCHRFKYI